MGTYVALAASVVVVILLIFGCSTQRNNDNVDWGALSKQAGQIIRK